MHAYTNLMKYLLLPLALLINVFAKAQTDNNNRKIFTYVDQMPAPPYNLGEYLGQNIRYPDSARMNNITGRVIIQFVVTEDGSITDCNVLRGIGGGCDEEALRVIKNMPRWKPGIAKGGKKVKVQYTQPISFTLEDDNIVTDTPANQTGMDAKDKTGMPITHSKKVDYAELSGIDAAVVPSSGKASSHIVTEKESGIYVYVSQMPEPGYDLDAYLRKNLRYPTAAKSNNIQGYVVVGFIINKDGSISECTVYKGLDSKCDEEAIRLIKAMPHWKPGKEDGKTVRVRSTQKVIFKL